MTRFTTLSKNPKQGPLELSRGPQRTQQQPYGGSPVKTDSLGIRRERQRERETARERERESECDFKYVL